MNTSTKTQPRRVRFLSNDHDFRCAYLASLGFSRAYIAEKTGLTKCQVGYRNNRAGIKLTDYRNGTSRVARIVMSEADQKIASYLREKLASTEERGDK
jgi:hypothetical protein